MRFQSMYELIICRGIVMPFLVIPPFVVIVFCFVFIVSFISHSTRTFAFSLNSDWPIAKFKSVVIGQGNYFGFARFTPH